MAPVAGTVTIRGDRDFTHTAHLERWEDIHVEAAVLPGGPNARIRLDFAANENVTYEVSFCERLGSPWTIASFATTPAGLANETSLTTFEGDVTVYLDRSTATGFYAVGMEWSEV